MNDIVNIAFNSLQGFGLTDQQKEDLIQRLQGSPEEQQKKEARKKLKKVSKKDLYWQEFDRQATEWLLKHHFKGRWK